MSADARLRSFIDRVLRLKEEQDNLAADIREVYAEAKGEGYDKTAMGNVVAHLRKVEKHGADKVDETQTVFSLYLDAYQRATGTVVATHTHEEIQESEGRSNRSGFSAPAGSASDEMPSANMSAQPEGETNAKSALQSADYLIINRRPGAANETGHQPSPDTAINSAPDESAADEISSPIPDDFQPPAFLVKAAKPLRPHCLNPDLCASGTRDHCHSCKKAMAAESEAA